MIETTPAFWPPLPEPLTPAELEVMIRAVVGTWSTSLRPWTADALQGFELPEVIFRFLAGYGLPADADLPLVRLVGPPLHWRWEGSRRLVLLGHDRDAELRMREGSGEVVSARPFRPGPPRFVNSSAIHLLECLRRYALRREDLRLTDDEGVVNIAEELRVSIGALDPRAVENADTWWSRALERVEAGFI